MRGAILEKDKRDTYYDVYKGDRYYNSLVILDSGEYSLVPFFDNEREIENNYNITKVNGILTVNGIDTKIEAQDIEYEYGSVEFSVFTGLFMVYDINDNIVSNVNLKYEITKEEEIIEKIEDAGTYSVKVIFEGSGNYNPSSTTIEVVVKPYIVYMEWNDSKFDSMYDGENKLETIEVKYMDINKNYIYAELNVQSMINAGEYTLIASSGNSNYVVSESTNTRKYTIEKIEVSLEIDNYEIEYQESISIEVRVNGLLERDNQGVSYNVYKNGILQDKESSLDCGLYVLEPILNNEEEIAVNYNITKVNGTLNIVGVETKIVYPDTINYEYTGERFVLDVSEVEVYDINDNKIENPEISYEILQLDEVIENAVNLGEYIINIFSMGNKNYSYCQKQVMLIISPKTVDIIWEGELESDYNGEDKISTIKAYYTNLNEEKVYLDIKEIELVNAGEYDLEVIFEDQNYSGSEATITKKYVINKLEVELSIGDYSINFGDDLPEIEIAVRGVILEKDLASFFYEIYRSDLNYEASYDLDCGLYILVPHLTNEEQLVNNYNITRVNGSLDVIGFATTIVFNQNFTHVYNGENYIPDLSGAKVYDLNNLEINNPSISYRIRQNDVIVESAINAGEYIIEVIFAGQGTHSSSRTFVNLTIEKANIIIEIDDVSSYYGDEFATLTYTVKEGVIHNDDLKITLTKSEGDNVGEYIIRGVSNNNNYNVQFIDGKYIINKRNVTIRIHDKQSDYLESIESLTYEVISGSVVNGDYLEISLTKEEGTDAGIYMIDGTYNNDNYNVNFVSGIYTIRKIDIENIVFEDVNKAYDGNSVNFGVSSTVLSDGSTVDIIYTLESGNIITNIVNAGSYVVKAYLSNKNYNDLILTANIVVEKATTNLGYSLSSIEVEYDENGYNYKLSSTVFEDGREANLEYYILKDGEMVEDIIEVGEYVVVANIKDDLDNYISTSSSQHVVIKHKNITIQYSNTPLIYNGYRQYPTFENEESFKITFNTSDGLAPINAGVYSLNVSSINPNYYIINSTFNFRINALAIEFGDSKYYEYNNETIQLEIVITNKIGNDDINLEVEYYFGDNKVNEVKNAGQYVIKAIGISGADSNNYKIENDEFALTVNPKKIIIKPSNTSKIYGTKDPNMKYTLTEELFENIEITGTLKREEGENTGAYLISAEDLVVPSNYVIEIHGAYRYFTIQPKLVNIDMDDNTVFEYDGTEKRLDITVSEGATIEYDGDMINPGEYIVKVVLINDNYCLPDGYQDIIVTINKKNISNVISIDKTEFDYTGNKAMPIVSCGDYDCVITYTKDSVKVDEMINPGIYKVIVLIENETELGEQIYKININKLPGSSREVDFEIYYNRIIVTKDDSLEYKIDNGDYYSNNEFNGLIASRKYIISVRRKETSLTYASDPIVYEVVTTDNPSEVHELIDELTNEINEVNLKLLKDIGLKIKTINYLDIDVNKYNKYKDIKRNFEIVINSYKGNIENANKVSSFLEGKIMLFNLLVSLVAFVVLKRRINHV